MEKKDIKRSAFSMWFKEIELIHKCLWESKMLMAEIYIEQKTLFKLSATFFELWQHIKHLTRPDSDTCISIENNIIEIRENCFLYANELNNNILDNKSYKKITNKIIETYLKMFVVMRSSGFLVKIKEDEKNG